MIENPNSLPCVQGILPSEDTVRLYLSPSENRRFAYIPTFFYLEIDAFVVRLSCRHTSTISVQTNADAENAKRCLPIGDLILNTCFGLRSYGSTSEPSCLVGACQITRKTGYGFSHVEGSLVEWQSRFDLTVSSPLDTKENTRDS